MRGWCAPLISVYMEGPVAIRITTGPMPHTRLSRSPDGGRPHTPLDTPSPHGEPLQSCPPGHCARSTPAVPMAEVVARCSAREVRTPTQYVVRWTEVAAVARDRGHLPAQTELSFDRPADVDAVRPVLEEAVGDAIAAEEGCGREPARERTRDLVGGLDRPTAKRGSGGRGKCRAAACGRWLGEIRDLEIAHELRWNRCAELAVSPELTALEAALLTVVAMYCVTGAFVCWETRAGLMAKARIKTNASFAAAVATLMRHGLLVPVDGAPRTAWHLGVPARDAPRGPRARTLVPHPDRGAPARVLRQARGETDIAGTPARAGGAGAQRLDGRAATGDGRVVDDADAATRRGPSARWMRRMPVGPRTRSLTPCG